jgi:hypothetical protein
MYTLECTNGEDNVSASVSVDFVPEEEPEPEGNFVDNDTAFGFWLFFRNEVD